MGICPRKAVRDGFCEDHAPPKRKGRRTTKAERVDAQIRREADRVDGYDRDDLGESPDY
jgi:hypothetical protein